MLTHCMWDYKVVQNFRISFCLFLKYCGTSGNPEAGLSGIYTEEFQTQVGKDLQRESVGVLWMSANRGSSQGVLE